MFPTAAHLNIGGSIHGGAVLSFIDMALFAGGRCAGMGEGHYVTLDCATHFIARGQIDVPLDAIVRMVGADPRRARLPVGALRAGRRSRRTASPGTLKRIRDNDVTGPVGTAYAALVAAGELKPDPDQARGRRRARPARRRARQGEARAACRACSAKPDAAARRLSVGRGRARQVDADGPGLRQHRRRAQAPRPFPRVHARGARAAARRAGERGGRPDHRRWPKQIADEAQLARLRRDGGQQQRRRDDPVAAVHRAARARAWRSSPPRTGRRATSTRTASTASCSCPSST